MPKQLTTQNASITTVAVEIQALTISGKQVTLSVFRQLREEHLIAHSGALNGVPWGFVNYHPDKCADDRQRHWHFVWQQGHELLRSRVDHELPRATWGCKEGDDFLSAHAREVFEHRGQYFGGRLPEMDHTSAGLVAALTCEAPFHVRMQLARGLNRAYFAWEEWREAADKPIKRPDTVNALHERRRREALTKAVEDLSCAPPEPGEVAELFAAFQTNLNGEIGRRERHRQVRAGLANLPQLFIAV